MKANIINRMNQNKITEVGLKREKFQKDLQSLENEFAKEHGIIPRTVSYAPFDRNVIREMIIENTVERYYPLNLDLGLTVEEFKDLALVDRRDEIESRLDFMSKNTSGLFIKSRKDKIFLFSNSIKDNMFFAKTVLKHETFHAGIYDLVRGRILKLKVYKNKHFDSQFMQNLLTEHKMKFCVDTRNAQMLHTEGLPAAICEYYSFEEQFVRYNTMCSMLEEEIKSGKIDLVHIDILLSGYIIESGLKIKPQIENKLVELYGKEIPLKSYLATYLQILRGPVENYGEQDKYNFKALENFETDNICFEEKESMIPELFEELITVALRGTNVKEVLDIIRKFKEKTYNFVNNQD